MRNIFPAVLTLALAAVIGGVGGYVVVDELVMRRPPEFVARGVGHSAPIFAIILGVGAQVLMTK